MQNIVLIFNIIINIYKLKYFTYFYHNIVINMGLVPRKIQYVFTFFKLPSAWWCGVRLNLR